jgi:hypothetical protein
MFFANAAASVGRAVAKPPSAYSRRRSDGVQIPPVLVWLETTG